MCFNAGRKLFFVLFYGVLIVFFFACDEVDPIFAGIESEELILTSNLPDNVTGLGLVKLGGQYLLATGGALYKRKPADFNWGNLSFPSGYDGVSGIVSVSSTLAYAIYVKGFQLNISEYALFSLAVSSDTSTDVVTTHIRTVRVSDDKAIDAIFVIQGVNNVYACVRTDVKASAAVYDYYANYQSVEPTLLVSDQNDTITGIAQQSDGTTYVSTQSQIFILENDALQLQKIQDSNQTDLKGLLGSIFVSSNDNIYVSAQERIWKYDGSWTSSFSPSTFFTFFAEIDEPGFTGILVGTRYYPGLLYTSLGGKDDGFREIEDGDLAKLSVPTGGKYTSGTLDRSGITGFVVDGNTVFVLTNANGVWRGDYTSGREVDWFLE